ncbi:hypothetical protein DYB37_012846 [Aphanomyces astaci]|uniref:Uncharacterized protein n=1 Tax=Aphanomyces astaci TaxID=112090 RepID=A0A3L6VX71_APHAT|nr:hypothetical protein DYB35_010251 [Aphanomyces astaci]RHZ31884.1 hypothetical protein DYB37_012846 [Aphanomyces astaci]RLO13445.1 hypothetical protein DYB28_000854 [Aphanomyces astaci]
MASPFRDKKRDPDGSPDVSPDKTEGAEELPIRSPRKKKTVQGREPNNRDELLPEDGVVDDEDGPGRLGETFGPVASVAVAPRVENLGEANPETVGVVGVRTKTEGRLGFVNAMREDQLKTFNDFLLEVDRGRMGNEAHQEVLYSGLVEDAVWGRTTDLDGQLAVTRVAHKELETLVQELSGMVENYGWKGCTCWIKLKRWAMRSFASGALRKWRCRLP